jgi:DNA polymerase-3 subunit gamma/tau
MMTGAAFNALLKTLEEPPAHVVFILATTESHKVPATIKSRCQRFDFKRIPQGKIAEHILDIAAREDIKITEDAADRIAILADGAMRDSLSLLGQIASFDKEITREVVEKTLGKNAPEEYLYLLETILKKDVSGALLKISELLSESSDSLSFASDFLNFCRDCLVIKNTASPENLVSISHDIIEKIKEMNMKNEEIILIIQKFCEVIANAKMLQNPRALVESAAILLAT